MPDVQRHGTLTGVKGAKLNFKIDRRAGLRRRRGRELQHHRPRHRHWWSGAYKKAKGSLKVTGLYKKSAKTFSIKFIGKLTV